MEDYGQPMVKRRRIPVWVWVVGGLLIGALLLGSCAIGTAKLFTSLNERGQASKALAEKIMFNNAIPDSSDPIWLPAVSGQEGFDEEIAKVNRLYAKFGAVTEVGEPSCSINSHTGTGRENGTFANCSMSFVSETSPGTVIVRWKSKDDEWRLYGFRANFSDMSVLIDDEEAETETTETDD